MDVAKVVAVLLCGGQALPDLYGFDQVAAGRLPLVLVPTTAGTDSEVTPVAVITTGETTKANSYAGLFMLFPVSAMVSGSRVW